jgi:hypothetical protein
MYWGDKKRFAADIACRWMVLAPHDLRKMMPE